jgi:hypothetical protein
MITATHPSEERLTRVVDTRLRGARMVKASGSVFNRILRAVRENAIVCWRNVTKMFNYRWCRRPSIFGH